MVEVDKQCKGRWSCIVDEEIVATSALSPKLKRIDCA
jgi:hypothetical protein